MDKDKRLPHYNMPFRVKPHIGRLLETVASRKGLSKTSVLVVALTEYAKREGIEIPSEDITRE